MRVTFDTNVLDKACRPARFPKDPDQPLYQKGPRRAEAGRHHRLLPCYSPDN